MKKIISKILNGKKVIGENQHGKTLCICICINVILFSIHSKVRNIKSDYSLKKMYVLKAIPNLNITVYVIYCKTNKSFVVFCYVLYFECKEVNTILTKHRGCFRVK